MQFFDKQENKRNIIILIFLTALLILALFVFTRVNNSETSQDNFGDYEKIVKSIDSGTGLFLTIQEYQGERTLSITDKKGEQINKISEGVFVYDAFWSDDRQKIIYTAVKENEGKYDNPQVDIWISDETGLNNELIKETNSSQVIAKLSPDNNSVIYTTPNRLSFLDLNTKFETELFSYPEFGENTDVLYVPEPFIQENEVLLVLKKYINGEVSKESLNIALPNLE